jgi:predicted alpha/beta hydrolase family esterase
VSALAPVVILPGLYDSGPQHWQSLWHAQHPEFERVVQADWETPRCADWVAVLDQAVAACARPPVLVGHSSACALVAHWSAARPGHTVHGALLVAPSDPDSPQYPEGPTGFAPMPLVRLPFPSVVVTSDSDVYVSLPRARRFADAWGGRLVVLADAGHVNAAAGFGEWPEGLALLAELRRT